MHLIFRTLLVMWRARRRRARGDTVGIYDVGRLDLRVLPTDQDILGHVNNGVYLSLFDLGRFDLMVRNGLWDQLTARGWYPVVVNQTVTYRKSLTLGQRFTIETRVLGLDERSVYLEHRMVRGGEIYTRAILRARFLKKTGGTVSIDELTALLGGQLPPEELPAWITQWAADTALPGTREPAPSLWN